MNRSIYCRNKSSGFPTRQEYCCKRENLAAKLELKFSRDKIPHVMARKLSI